MNYSASVQSKFVSDAKAKDGAHSVTVDELPEQVKNNLRNRYLHLSAYKEGGQSSLEDYFVNQGRYDIKGLPDREIIEG